MANGEQNSGNSTSAMAKLLNQLNLPTLLAVLFMNGWGIRTTENKGQELSDEQKAAYRKLNQLYEALDDFEKRQAQVLANQAKILQELEQLNHKP